MLIEYFEDIELHQTWKSKEYNLSEKEIIHFDTQWNPVSPGFGPSIATKKKTGGLSAAGAHLMAICGRILPEKQPSTAVAAGLSVDKLTFPAPARPGDVLTLESEVLAKRESKSRPDTGIVSCAIRLLNQKNEIVLNYESTALVERRPRR